MWKMTSSNCSPVALSQHLPSFLFYFCLDYSERQLWYNDGH